MEAYVESEQIAAATGRGACERVPTVKRSADAAPAFVLAVVGIAVYVHLPKFYPDAVGVRITMLGYLPAFARIFYPLIDPGMAINTGASIGVFFLGPGDASIYGALVFLSGIGFGAIS